MGNGQNKGTAPDGRPVSEHIKEAKQRLIDNALDKLGILLDSPTASGSGGNSGSYTVILI